MPFVAGAMLAGSALSFSSARSSRKSMAKEMKAWRRLQQRQLDFAKERWQHYRDTYGGIERLMVADAIEGVKGDYVGVADRAANDVESKYDSLADRTRRRLTGLGIDPSSGRFQSTDREVGLQLAKDSALMQNTARTKEKERVDRETWQRRYGVGTFGSNMMLNAGRDVQNSMAQMGQMHQSNANTYGNMSTNLFMQAGQMGMYGLLKGSEWVGSKFGDTPATGLDMDWSGPAANDYGPPGTMFNSGLDGFGSDAMTYNDLWNAGAN